MKNFLMLLLISFSIFQMYGNGFACIENKIKTEESCCKKEIRLEIEKKYCSHLSSVCKKECHDKFGHSTSTTNSSTHFSIINAIDINFHNNNFSFSLEKLKFHHLETFFSSGFNSIWIIPKTG
ncbi:hypothetical protein [Flavobacterium maritimum]|uniref:hypothetical protein n=1 Tax=Flavobacterium maritimum TaxID=3149042 RepID=UPI0032B5FD5B